MKTADLAVLNEAIRLKALGTSLQAMAIAADEHDLSIDFVQVEEIGKMICELTATLQEKLEEWKPAQKPKAA
ncbi:MAG: hypothetical protein C4567_07595 [Deltaproteobacteria bacterium]|nr:MAG: hypothetical protein C4567_07595 [Deltaproteobacteria bacterium]